MEDYFDFDSREVFEELVAQWQECENDRNILRRCCEAYQYIVEKQKQELEAAQAEAELWHNRFSEVVAQQAKMAENGARLADLLANAMMKGGRSDE